jgi:hypothetical protein
LVIQSSAKSIYKKNLLIAFNNFDYPNLFLFFSSYLNFVGCARTIINHELSDDKKEEIREQEMRTTSDKSLTEMMNKGNSDCD